MHTTVLLNEAVESLIMDPSGCYIDASFGRGGHSRAILDALNEKGRLIVVDRDRQAIEVAEQLAATDPRVVVEHSDFAQIENIAQKHRLRGEGVNGVLVDLGVSSPQLDEAHRGFSFMQDGPLDMRMDRDHGETAMQWLATAEVAEIARVLKVFGEERFATRISHFIVEAREEAPIETTLQLADLISRAIPKSKQDKAKHPATRSFQAIRIYINKELEQLETFLEKATDVLTVGGRLVVISFHSLEDRMVKRFIRDHERGPKVPSYIPLTAAQGYQPILGAMGKAIKPSQKEIAHNPRARSAVMRVAEKYRQKNDGE